MEAMSPPARACSTLVATLLIAGVTLSMVSLATPSRADPMLTRGIGITSCEKLAPDIKPAEGLNHQPNYLLFYWVQGYISAANIYLLNEYTDYVDMGTIDEKVILQTVLDFCKANPDKKPIAAIDKFIREAKKVEAKESDAFDPWEH
jgi:hypothetical protein